jgi:cytochrome c
MKGREHDVHITAAQQGSPSSVRDIFNAATLRVCMTTVALIIAQTVALRASAAELTGDPARGRQVFAACRTCHYPEQGYGHHNGPSLFAIFGRTAGTQADFDYYSAWLKQSGLVWTPELLDAWLANPRMLPQSAMVFVGIPDAQARADLIAYLAQFR